MCVAPFLGDGGLKIKMVTLAGFEPATSSPAPARNKGALSSLSYSAVSNFYDRLWRRKGRYPWGLGLASAPVNECPLYPQKRTLIDGAAAATYGTLFTVCGWIKQR